jgi:hypothetical protein
MRNRNENVEGLSEPHDMELTLDGERLEVFTIVPNRNASGGYYADEAVDRDLRISIPVKAGPHAIAPPFLERRPRSRKPSASRTTRISTWTVIRVSARGVLRFHWRAL